MSFIEQAKEVLSVDKMNRLELLAMKSANFETNSEEDFEFSELKKEVKKLIANRDRQKNLNFLIDGNYSIIDVLEVMKITPTQFITETKTSLTDIIKAFNYSKKQVMNSVNEIYAGSTPNKASFQGVLATYKHEDVTLTQRITKSLNKMIQEGGEKTFVENLTESGREWIVQSHISERGPYKGQQIFANVNFIALKFKFDKEKLKKELGLIKVEEKPQQEKTEKKSQAKAS